MKTISGLELGTQLMVSQHRPDSTRFVPAAFAHDYGYMNKPKGGMWTSSLTEDGLSDWIRWCREECFGLVDEKPWWHLVPEPRATLLQVDSVADLKLLMDVFGRTWGPVAEVERQSIDFDAIKSAGYAGVNLTVDGAVACHFGDWNTGLTLNAWDCESTVWLRWSFVDVCAAPVPEEAGAA